MQAVDSARDKHATRAVMEEAGLPTPRNMLITSQDVLDRVRAGQGVNGLVGQFVQQERCCSAFKCSHGVLERVRAAQ